MKKINYVFQSLSFMEMRQIKGGADGPGCPPNATYFGRCKSIIGAPCPPEYENQPCSTDQDCGGGICHACV